MAELPEYKVTIEPMDPESSDFIENGRPAHLGLRTKFGGKPSSWTLENEDVKCDKCAVSMNFVAQLDSINHDSKNNPIALSALSKDPKHMFGDVWMIYVYFCPKCYHCQAYCLAE